MGLTDAEKEEVRQLGEEAFENIVETHRSNVLAETKNNSVVKSEHEKHAAEVAESVQKQSGNLP